MLVKHTPDAYEKLQILGGMQVAGDDVLSRPERGSAGNFHFEPERYSTSGVYQAKMPNGKHINLMRVMFTDFCKMDCAYCPNSTHVPRKRYAFKVDELAKTFNELQQRQTVSGLFLSSGIAGSASRTTERLVRVVEVIRQKYDFKGYIHMKVMPGTEYQYVEAAYRLGTRLSINMETPTTEMMRKLSAMKDLERDILAPMGWIDGLTRGDTSGAVGQATQLVVGAADESDLDVFQRIDQLYTDWNLKRVYYSPFRPIPYTPLEERPPTPMLRTNRLYQVDWLKRVYRFSNDELRLAFDKSGFLPLGYDPKTTIAIENLDAFPLEVNSATHAQLLRVPGVGPASAQRIVQNRRRHSIDTWRDLQAMGVVRKWAWPFVRFPGYRPPGAKQLKLDLFGEEARSRQAQQATAIATKGRAAVAPCGQERSCVGCPMFGMPGHPGSE